MILVTGGTGTVGREVVKELGAAGARFRMLVGSRDKAPSGVEAIIGDLGQPATLRDALAGVDTLFLLTNVTPDLAGIHKGAVDAAKAAGVRRVVRLTVPDPEKNAPIAFARWHAEADDYVRASGLAWTLVCPAYFSQNFLRSAGTIRSRGVFFGAMKDGLAAFVDARDVAAVVAGVLTEGGHDGASLLVTGPALHTQSEGAAVIGKEIGEPVKYVDLAPEQLEAGVISAGVPAWMAKDAVAMHVAFSKGIGAHLSPVVREITGRPPRAFEEFVRDYRQEFC